jgi:hypothetical protein
MSLTKRQKTLSAVFLIGLVGLVVDRTILRPQGGPRAASAEPLSAAMGSAGSSSSGPLPEPAPPATVAQRLSQLAGGQPAGSEELRDPFSLPLSWSDTLAGKEGRTTDAGGAFARRHQFRAVAVRDGQSGALVDDSFLTPGQSLDGYTLVSLGSRSALFERDGKQVMLQLADP